MEQESCQFQHHQIHLENIMENNSKYDLFDKIVQEIETQPIAYPQHKNGCKCKKTKCLKLYCQCFSSKGKCSSSCSCQGCENYPGNQLRIFEAKKQANERNPGFFKEVERPKYIKRCNCKKTHCTKKYCECFNAGIKCGQWCKCENCSNCEGPANPKNMQHLLQV